MKTNNIPNVSELSKWIDLQLSTIIEGVSAGYTLGNGNTVWIDKGDKVFNVSLANGNTVKIDSDNYNNSKEIANAIIATLNTNTPATMNANETTESKTMYTDYYTAVNWCGNALILCNNIAEIDPSVYDNMRFEAYDEETDTYTDIYQWFITDCSEADVEFLEEHFPGLLFTYSGLLDNYILCVDHFGTMWKGVATETTLEYAAEKSQLGK